MKINSVNIVSFGKIKNLQLNFTDNFNLIYGDNEAGKTHIADFIKIMFYGNGFRGQGVNNLRKKYKPWDNSKMGGSINFTSNGTRYKLEREFKASNSADSVILYNLDTGVSQTLSGNDNIGSDFFGMSISAFEQSVFIDNSVVFSGKSDNSELNLKLANITDSADEDISFEKIVKNIAAGKEVLVSKNGKKGIVPELEFEISALNEQLKNSIEIYKTAEEKNAELKELESIAENVAENKKNIFERIKTYEQLSLKQKLTEFKNAVDEYNKTETVLTLSNGIVADSTYLENCERLLESLKRKTDMLKEKKLEAEQDAAELASFSDLPSADREISKLAEEKNALAEKIKFTESAKLKTDAAVNTLNISRTNIKGKRNPALIISGAIVSVLGIAAGFFNAYAFAAAIIGIILLICGTVLKSKPDYSEIDNEIKEKNALQKNLQDEIDNFKTELEKINDKINRYTVLENTNISLMESKKQEALKKRESIIKLQEKIEPEKAALFSEISKFKPVYDIMQAEEALTDIKKLLLKLSETKIRADVAISHTGCRSTSDAIKRLEALPDNLPEIYETREQLDDMLQKETERGLQLQNKIISLKAELKTVTSGIRTPAEYEREISEKNNALYQTKKFLSEIEIAEDTLAQAYALQRRSFSGILEKRASEIFSQLTGNSYSDMSVSKDFEMNVKSESDITSHNVEFLSKGTLHQAYFSLRLALSELLSNQSGSLPVILDDVFAQYDSYRANCGFEFLKKYSENNQVIFFTCHRQLCENENINVISL